MSISQIGGVIPLLIAPFIYSIVSYSGNKIKGHVFDRLSNRLAETIQDAVDECPITIPHKSLVRDEVAKRLKSMFNCFDKYGSVAKRTETPFATRFEIPQNVDRALKETGVCYLTCVRKFIVGIATQVADEVLYDLNQTNWPVDR